MTAPGSPGAAAGSRWHIVFGDTVQVLDRGAVHPVGTRKALALLVLLAFDGATTRPRLARLLWPDVSPEAARRNLRRELFRWRQAGLVLRDLDGQRLGLDHDDVTITHRAGSTRWTDTLLGVAGEDLEDWLAQRTRPSGPAVPTAAAESVGPLREAPTTSHLVSPPFVDRPHWRTAIDQAWAAGRSVFLAGAPGIGKTRMALEVAARHGAVLHVAARPEDAGAPFAAAIRGLRALHDAAPDVALPAWVRETLATIMPDWTAAGGPAVESLGGDLHTRLAAAGAVALRRLAADNFNVLVFDDWQWVDAESARWWMQLDAADPGLTAAGPLPLRLVAYRAGELPSAVLAHVRAVCDGGQAVRLTLDDWQADEVARLVAGSLGAPDERLATHLHATTGGHPLFVLETLRWLQSEPPGAGDGPPRTPVLPPSVREAVLARVHALGPMAARVLQAASLAVPPLRARALSQVSGEPVPATEAALMHAVAAGLLVDDGGLRFAHDLVRESLRDALPQPRREAWHAAWADQAAATGAPPGQVASHWDAAGEPQAARPWHAQAAEAALRVHALPQAVVHWRAALAADPAPADAVAWGLQCADALVRLDDVAAADAALRAAAAAADALPALRRRVRATQAQVWARSGRLDDAEALLAQIAPDAGEGLHPVLAVTRAEVAQRRGELDRALALCTEAAAQWPDEPGALPAIADALCGVARAAAQAGDFDTGAQACERGLALLRAVDAPVIASGLLSMLGVVQTWRGERDAARATFTRAAGEARRGGHPNARRMALLNLAKLHSDAGEIAACLAALDELDSLPPAADAVRGELFVAQVRWFAHWLQGDLEPCREAMPQLLALANATADAYARLSTLQLVVDLPLLVGDLDAARMLLDRALTDPGLPQAGPIRTTVDNKQAWWLLRAGQPSAALAWLDAAAPADLDEARLLRAAVRAGALRVLGRPDEALAAVQAVAPDAEGSGDTLARWLAEWWLCTRTAGHAPDAVLVAATQTLLAGPRAPALDRRALQAAAGLAAG